MATEQRDQDLSKGVSTQLEISLRRYLKVWIWSIVFGLDTALSLSYSIQSISGKYISFIAITISAPNILALLLVIISWLSVIRFMQAEIIPIAFGRENTEEDESSKHQLISAMQVAVLAMVCRVIGFVVEALFGSLGRF